MQYNQLLARPSQMAQINSSKDLLDVVYVYRAMSDAAPHVSR